MSDERQIPDNVKIACEVAMGGPRDENAAGHSIRAGHKDLNAKGNGPWWYRMVWRNGQWQYFSDERLPMGTFLASDRRATVRGDVFCGELVCQHDKGGPVDGMWLIADADEAEDALVAVEWRKRRDGRLAITLPDGREVIVPNPRSR